MNQDSVNMFKRALRTALTTAINDARPLADAPYTDADVKKAFGPTFLRKINIKDEKFGANYLFLHLGQVVAAKKPSKLPDNYMAPAAAVAGPSDAKLMKTGMMFRIHVIRSGCRPGDVNAAVSVVGAGLPNWDSTKVKVDLVAGQCSRTALPLLDEIISALRYPDMQTFMKHLRKVSDCSARRIRQHEYNERERGAATHEAPSQKEKDVARTLIEELQANSTVERVAMALPSDVRPKQVKVVLTTSYSAMNQSHEQWIEAGCPLVFEPVTHMWDAATNQTMVVFECCTHTATLNVTYAGQHLDSDGNVKDTDVLNFAVASCGVECPHRFTLSDASGQSVAVYVASQYEGHANDNPAFVPEDGWEWLTPIARYTAA